MAFRPDNELKSQPLTVAHINPVLARDNADLQLRGGVCIPFTGNSDKYREALLTDEPELWDPYEIAPPKAIGLFVSIPHTQNAFAYKPQILRAIADVNEQQGRERWFGNSQSRPQRVSQG
jgi:hypothetical protein